MKKIIQVVAEAVIVVISVLIASQLHLHYSVIPSFIFRYQRGFFNDKEIITIISVYVVVAAVILLVSKIIKIGNIFKSAEYFAREVFLIALGSSISALVIFVFTKVFFDPNFVALQFIIVIVLYFCGFIVLNVRSGAGQLASVFRHGLKYAFSVSGIVMILVCLSPIAMAVYFKKDKDFANVINQIRNLSEGVGLEWQLVGAYDQVPFIQPIYIRQTKAMPDRLFVLERAGRLNSLTLDGKKELLLDYSKRVGIVKVENGAVGFALHPEFGNPNSPNKGYVYVYYTDVNEERQINRLSRFDLSLPSLEERFASETVLIEQTRNMSGFHNGGTVAFGPDGFLYIGIGDASTKVNHQTISGRLFSGIFRIDVDSRGGAVSHPIKKHPDPGFTGHYMIPNDNPFVGQDGVLEEFWALGLRNPFRFSFDTVTAPRQPRIAIGDVGQSRFEELDYTTVAAARGANFGWDAFEGFAPYRDENSGTPDPGGTVKPILAYPHSRAGSCSIIGGYVIGDRRLPSLHGRYVYADLCEGELRSLVPHLRRAGDERKLGLSVASPSSFGEDERGRIYVCSLDGPVYRLVAR